MRVTSITRKVIDGANRPYLLYMKSKDITVDKEIDFNPKVLMRQKSA